MPNPVDMLPNRPENGGRGWAILQHPFTRIVLGVIFVELLSWATINLGLVFFAGLDGDLSQEAWDMAYLKASFVTIGVAVLFYLLIVWTVERRRAREFAVGRLVQDSALGTALSFGQLGLQVGLLWLAGGYVVESFNGASPLLLWLGFALLAGVVEELVFRGIGFRILEEWQGSWWALAISALFFGGVHAWNPSATLWTTAAIAVEAGILIGAAYMATRTLWLPIALHTSWNFILGGVFGLAVSGHVFDGLVTASTNGPWWVTGGEFGLEAAIPNIAMSLTVAGFFLFYAGRRGRILSPGWARRAREAEVAS